MVIRTLHLLRVFGSIIQFAPGCGSIYDVMFILRSRYIDHELIVALLTCGPVGFGDSLPNKGFLGTNVTKLLLTSRSDGILLKPAHTALRSEKQSLFLLPLFGISKRIIFTKTGSGQT